MNVMNVKITLLALSAVLLGHPAPAQVPPPDANGSNAPSHEEVLRRALRDQTNAAAATATPAEAATPHVVPTLPSRPLTFPTNRPAFRGPRPNIAPAATPAASTAPTAEAPAAAPVIPAALPAGALPPSMPLTPRNSTASMITNPDEIVPALSINFSSMPLEKVLEIYADYVGRNLLRPSTLPDAKIVLRQTTPLTKLELVRAMEAAMALNNVSVVNVGDKFVTAMPTADIYKIPGRVNTNGVSELSELGSFATHIVQLKYTKPTELVQVLTPFASGTTASPILPVDGSGILVLRDNVANVKRMLEMIEKVDVTAQSEFESEVIPIKFAKAEEIASALSSIGGGTGGTIGSRPTGGTGTTSGFNRGLTGASGTGMNQPGMVGGGLGGGATPMPSSGQTFGDRLNNIIRKAASSGDLQILGTTKIIADIRSNSLLVFATREDMKTIKNIIEKLDVVLAQVLIETIIMDVSLSDNWEFGVSAAQDPKNNFSGLGGVNNGNPFYNFLSSATNAFPGNFTTALPSGMSYFGKVGAGPSFEMAIKAAAGDSRVNVIQKPRVQTSHATPASIFVGSTVPYISGTYYGYGGSSPSSSYQQLRVGIGLNVTPFINQDGLVVMKIEETIDEVGESVKIDNNLVPKTTSRTLSAEVAVRDRETIVLGGFVRNSDSKSRSGVPLLKDIPLLGALFTSSTSDKARSELMVLMRPTVLKTPEMAAMHVAVEKERLPGVVAAEKDLDKVELGRAAKKQAEANQKKFDETTPFNAEERKLYSPSGNKP